MSNRKSPRTPEQIAEERAIHERSRRERPSRAEMIASGDIDPADSTTVADHIARRRADLARLAAATDGPIDASDIPEATGPGRRVVRDAEGRLLHTPDAETEARRAMRPELRRAAAASWEHNRDGLGYLAGRTPCPLPHVPDAETGAALRAADAIELSDEARDHLLSRIDDPDATPNAALARAAGRHDEAFEADLADLIAKNAELYRRLADDTGPAPEATRP